MKKYLGCLALLLALGGSMRGQSSLPVVQGNVSASSTNCSTAFSCVWQNALAFNASTTTVAVSGTFTATLLVEESNNGGQTWATVATLSAAGTTSYSTNGFTDVRVRCSAFTSGTATITLNTGLTTGGGGGGAVSSVFSRTGAVVATANDYSVAQLSGLPCTAPQGCTGVASPAAHADPQAEGASVYNFIGPGLTGQVKTAINGADPSYKSPGLSGTDVNSATYLVQCDSATALVDRGTTLRFITTTPTVTVPDPTAAGCGSNFGFVMVASGVTATVNRTSTAVFNIYGRSGDPTLAATTFNLTTGQYAAVSSPDNVNWLVRIVNGIPTSVAITGGTNGFLSKFNASGNEVPTLCDEAITTANTITCTDTAGIVAPKTGTGTPPAVTAGTGGFFACTEGTNATPLATADILNCNSANHDLETSYNGGSFFHLPQVIANGTAAMTTAAITAGNCGTTVTVSATGVATTDTITWAFNASPAGTNAGLVGWPTANNVNFAYCGIAETPAAATINWRVVR